MLRGSQYSGYGMGQYMYICIYHIREFTAELYLKPKIFIISKAVLNIQSYKLIYSDLMVFFGRV